MWNHFRFSNGSNPYITTSNKTLFWQICHYEIHQVNCTSWIVKRQFARRLQGQTREERKAILRDFAIEWQSNFNRFNYSWGELAEWQNFFDEYGRKFGLLKEFRENGIL